MVSSVSHLNNCNLFPFHVAHIVNTTLMQIQRDLHLAFKSRLDEFLFEPK